MNENGKHKLHSVLFDGDKSLVNLKLFPGTGRELSAETLGEAAATALSQTMAAWESGVPSKAPATGVAKRSLMG